MGQPSLPTVHKAYHYELSPTPAQAHALHELVWRCRVLYNTALEQRISWWRRTQSIVAPTVSPAAGRAVPAAS